MSITWGMFDEYKIYGKWCIMTTWPTLDPQGQINLKSKTEENGYYKDSDKKS